MATGDQADITARLKRGVPRAWFGDTNPLLTGALAGIASAHASIYSMIAYAKQQTRIATATDGWLDAISFDFFGTRLPRGASQSDASYRARILPELLREKGTRRGVIKALTDLTGRTPVVFEPARPADAFCLGAGYLGVGRVGSYAMPFQALITAFRPLSVGVPNIAGLHTNYSGLGSPYMALANSSMIGGSVADADIYAAIDAARPVPAVAWVNIQN